MKVKGQTNRKTDNMTDTVKEIHFLHRKEQSWTHKGYNRVIEKGICMYMIAYKNVYDLLQIYIQMCI